MGEYMDAYETYNYVYKVIICDLIIEDSQSWQCEPYR